MIIDYETEYDNLARVPEHPGIVERWLDASTQYRASSNATLDVSYGKGDKCQYDLFAARGAGDPIAVYIHGGYWQRGDRKGYSFVARTLNERGVSVAIPSYTLCPGQTIAGIVGEIRQCLTVLWQRTGRRPVIIGHSAGGHLAAAMMATNWSSIGGVPSDLVAAAVSISGLFDLPPLIETSLNTALRLTHDAARAASPIFWQAPSRDCRIIAAVGGLESPEFLRQSLDLVEVWSRAGVKAECVVVPSTNHFTVVDELVRPDSAMLARVVAMAKMQ